MSRIITRLILAGAFLCVAGSALATPMFLTSDPVMFRSSRSVNSLGFVDSSIFRRGAASAETTAAYSTANLVWSDFARASTDSMWLGNLYIRATGSTAGPTNNSDTLWVGEQGSFDGITWVTTTPTATFVASSGPSGLAAATSNAIMIVKNAGEVYYRSIKATGSPAVFGNGGFAMGVSTGAATPTSGQLPYYNYIRYIIWSDAQGEYSASISHWTIPSTNYGGR